MCPEFDYFSVPPLLPPWSKLASSLAWIIVGVGLFAFPLASLGSVLNRAARAILNPAVAPCRSE